jgi:hypothetical protein
MTYPMLQRWAILLCFVSLSIASAAHGVSSVGMVRDMAKLSSEVHILVDDRPTTTTSSSSGSDSCADDRTTHDPATRRTDLSKAAVVSLRGGGGSIFPAGWNPMGYKITPLGERFLSMGDSLSCDVGRFLASLKSNRKRRSILKDSWLEIVRASKTGQAMRIYRTIDDLLDFCLQAGLVD